MSSEVALVLDPGTSKGSIPEVKADILVEINGGIIQSIRSLDKLPFPIRVHIRDRDLSRVDPGHQDELWFLGLPGEALGA